MPCSPPLPPLPHAAEGSLAFRLERGTEGGFRLLEGEGEGEGGGRATRSLRPLPQEASTFRLPAEMPPLSYDETTWEWQIHTNYISYAQALSLPLPYAQTLSCS